MTAITLSKLCSVTSLKNRNSLYSAFTKRPSRCPNSRLIVANTVSRSVRWLTSARTARLPAPSVSLAACSDPLFKPQMATRAPSRSNSCAAASPIPRDVERVLATLSASGYETELPFPHWLGKARCSDDFVGVLFSSGNGGASVDKQWVRPQRLPAPLSQLHLRGTRRAQSPRP